MNAIFVTGSSKGIGAAAARLFKEQGFFVYLHGRTEVDLRRLEEELGQDDSVLLADLMFSDQVEGLARQLKQKLAKHGHVLKTLVNNAGIFRTQSSTVHQHEAWEQQFRVNILSAAQLTELLLPELRKAAPASIVNVSSTVGIRPAPNMVAYAASKAAMNNWTKSLALELGPHGIRANCVCPGIVDTPIHSFHHLESEAKTRMLEKMASLQPMGRIGEVQDIAQAIVFLASEKSSWTTGAVLSVDGGIDLQ